MRPVRLTFAGLRSYRSETVIDFTDLDLFAVIGDTGAGKSTLIEALCLGLYARKSWTGGEAGLADMITDGVNTMRIELTFVAGGHEWTVTRARHRNSSAPIDKLVSTTGGIGADGARAVTERVTELIGLTYEQFTRAVVLPQGRFDTLLRATEKERNQILTSILDLGDVVATRARVEALVKEWSPQVTRWVARREQYPPDPVAAVRDAEVAASAAGDRERRLAEASDRAGELAAASAAGVEARRALRAALAAVVPVDPAVVGQMSALGERWARLEKDRDEAHDDLSTSQARLDELAARSSAILGGFPGRDDMVAAVTDLRRVADELPAAVAALESARRRVESVAADPPATEVPARLVVAATAADAALDRAAASHAEAERRSTEARRRFDDVHVAQSRADLARSAVAATEGRVAKGEAVVAAARTELAAAEATLAEAEAAAHAALVADAVATAAAGCGAGDDCPVCARTLPDGFVAPAASTDVDTTQTALAAAQAAVADARSSAADLAGKLAGLEAELTHQRQALADADESLGVIRSDAARLGVAVDEPDADAALAGPRRDVAAASAALADARVASRDAAEALTRASAGVDAAIAAHAHELAAARSAVEIAEQALARLRSAVDRLPAPWRADQDLDHAELGEVASAALRRLEAAVADLTTHDEERAALTAMLLAAERRVGEIDRRLVADVQQPLDRLVRRIDERNRSLRTVVVAAGPAVELVGDVWSPVGPADLRIPDDVATLDATIHRLEELVEAGTSIELEAGRIADRLDERARADDDQLSAVLAAVDCATVDELQSRRGAAGVERQHADRSLVDARRAAEVAAGLDAILAVGRPFAANLSVLEVALRSQHFIAHLVDAREQELLAEASRRLKEITKGRFGFVADFGIVSIGSGEVRSPDTLSGGERFQAALALALGLVEIASRGGGRLDAVFVDEGFGSLDHHALDVALDTLGTVAGGGKMVALISHLRPVAEFVDTVLLVTKDDMLGSRIELLDADERDEMLADDIRSGLTA